jgi:hypothetical protein
VAHVGIRNEGPRDVLLDVLVARRLSRSTTTWAGVRAPAESDTSIEFDRAMLEPVAGDAAITRIMLRPVALDRLAAAEMLLPAQLQATEVRLLRRTDGANVPILPGESFPVLGLGDQLGTPVDVTATRTRVVLYQSDCALIWPELMELAWRKRQDDLAVTLVSAYFDPRVTTYLGLQAFQPLQFGEGALVWADGRREPLGDSLYDRFLSFGGSRNGAHWPTDQIVGVDGRLVRIERAYRGRHPL